MHTDFFRVSKVVTNFRNTATNFRNLLGLKFKDPAVQHELQYSSVSCVETSDGGVGVQVSLCHTGVLFVY